MRIECVTCIACEDTSCSLVKIARGFSIYQCCNCELRFVPPEMLAEIVDYDDLYAVNGEFSAHMAEADALAASQLPALPRAKRVALDRLEKIRPSTLLEVGCGIGAFLAHTKELGCECFGVDPSSNAISRARDYLSCQLDVGALTPDVFPGRTFDVICSWEVLEHVKEVTSFLDTIRDRLTPGGMVFLSTPNYDSHWIWRDLEHDRRSSPPVHRTFWNRTSLSSALLRAGFRGITVRPYSIPLSAAQRSAGTWGQLAVISMALLMPNQRATLYAAARKSATS
jgi:SAM-dependent methyltransferase